jgi:hypothetical protein
VLQLVEVDVAQASVYNVSMSLLKAPLGGLPGAPHRRVRTPAAALDQWPRAARRGDHGSHRNNRQRLTSNLERTEDAR